MVNVRRLLVPVLLLLLLPACADGAVSPEREAKIREVLELTGAAKMGEQVMTAMMGQMKQAFPAVPEDFWSRTSERMTGEGLTDLVIPIYARNYTDEELDAMIAFWSSPAGRSISAKQSIVLQESMAAGQAWGEKLAEQVVAELREEGHLD